MEIISRLEGRSVLNVNKYWMILFLLPLHFTSHRSILYELAVFHHHPVSLIFAFRRLI